MSGTDVAYDATRLRHDGCMSGTSLWGYAPRLWAYAPAMQCPVVTSGMVIRGGLGYGGTRSALLS
eukprot:3940896-Rhodomonas_salina.1